MANIRDIQLRRKPSRMTEPLHYRTAAELAAEIRAGHLSARELVTAQLAQIERWNAHVNAIVTLDADAALAAARHADEEQAHGGKLGPLHGLPIVHKDLFATRGMRTTYGSLAFAHNVPTESALIVEREQRAGAITLGKSNTPEFGAGSQTFNAVFGKTRNPYALDRTCGGSSGGAAVALACGMVPMADGTDMGGSLRCPANFCNVVGFRPSIGRVPVWPTRYLFGALTTPGPLARTVADAALLFSVQCGPDTRSPLSQSEPFEHFARALERDFRGARIAFTPDMGGLPVHDEVEQVLRSRVRVFEDLGMVVEEACPDFADADEIFLALRALAFETSWGPALDEHRELLKETVVWNIEAGRRLTGAEIARAERQRSLLCSRVSAFMRRYEFIAAPVNQVLPFPVDDEYVRSINGIPMRNYIDWMRSCYYITLTGQPAISVPCGFSASGLPVGLQIVGRAHDDWGVLQLAHAFEQATQAGLRRPALPEETGAPLKPP
jgi:amidase